MLRIISMIKRLYRRCPFDKAVRPRALSRHKRSFAEHSEGWDGEVASPYPIDQERERAPREKENFPPKK
ncbi:hypothetical protein [Dapis sp. BLCC M229]|uniref:hypothetical protein n=1 Tax=Dapis sp. BLCC M229 TaxID=3400188 RepID=UPI003CE7F5FD